MRYKNISDTPITLVYKTQWDGSALSEPLASVTIEPGAYFEINGTDPLGQLAALCDRPEFQPGV